MTARLTRSLVSLSLFAGLMSAAEDFSIVVFPDTQTTSGMACAAGNCAMWDAEIQWILDNRVRENIQAVLHVGDIVYDNTVPGEWIGALQGSGSLGTNAIMSAGIPFDVAGGNHDIGGAYRTAANYNSHFGPSYFRGKSWYGTNFEAGHNENSYITWTVGGLKFMAVTIEFYARVEAIAWARSVIDAHPDYNVIVVTHGYLIGNDRVPYTSERALDGTRYGPNYYSIYTPGQSQYAAAAYKGTNGQQLWEMLLRRCPNIFAVFSGHFQSMLGYRKDVGDSGNLVCQIAPMWDSATIPYLVQIKIKPSSKAIEVHHMGRRGGWRDLTGYSAELAPKTYRGWRPITGPSISGSLSPRFYIGVGAVQP